ncbi:hypothetical protein [Rhizobium sp. 18065]|uniref:hypothetical protein n=1 Tax=Rhizobium sp. 18065 TaxID=2681411 RepID=UPI00135927AD|nr:hypothetical protein [Rhizobium sp. 18065]
MEVDTSITTFEPGTTVDIDAEVKAAEQREREFLEQSRVNPGEETPKAEAKDRPENVPEEFWDAEKGEVDWVKLNERLTKGDEKTDETPDADQGFGEVNGHKLTAKHAEDFKPFYEALESGQPLPADAVKYVEDTFGIKTSPEIIEAYMRGQTAKATGEAQAASLEVQTAALGVVGSEENYSAMQDWAGSVLTEAEANEYDEAVLGSDPKLAKLAVQALWNRYKAEADIPPSRQIGTGRTSSGASGTVYADMNEYVRDTMKPEYQNDPAFRAKCDAKLSRTGNLTIPS